MDTTNQILDNMQAWRREQLYSIAQSDSKLEKPGLVADKPAESPANQLLQHIPDEILGDFQRTLENILSLRQKDNAQIIGITSAYGGEGTSTICAILSLLAASRQSSAAQYAPRLYAKRFGEPEVSFQSQNILLIDAQFKNPTLHKLLGQNRQPGLNDFLESKADWNSSIRNIAGSRLLLVPAGRRTEQSIYNLYLDDFYSLLERVRTHVSFVFIDIPPLLDYAEGITLGKLCDGIILVLKSAQTRWEAVMEAGNLLQKANINVLGAILNNRKSYIPQWLSRYL